MRELLRNKFHFLFFYFEQLRTCCLSHKFLSSYCTFFFYLHPHQSQNRPMPIHQALQLFPQHPPGPSYPSSQASSCSWTPAASRSSAVLQITTPPQGDFFARNFSVAGVLVCNENQFHPQTIFIPSLPILRFLVLAKLSTVSSSLQWNECNC